MKNSLKLGKNHPRDLDYYSLEFQKNPQLLLKAYEGGKIKAVLLGSVEGDHVLIGELVVSIDDRRKGIGSKLLAQLEFKAKEIGQNKILLGARKEAEDFYLRNGYQPKLFIQVTGDDSLIKLDQFISSKGMAHKISWRDYSNRMAKAVIETPTLDQDLQNSAEVELKGCVTTQYLFSKQL